MPNFWRYRNDTVTGLLKDFNTADKDPGLQLVDKIEAATAADPPAGFSFTIRWCFTPAVLPPRAYRTKHPAILEGQMK